MAAIFEQADGLVGAHRRIVEARIADRRRGRCRGRAAAVGDGERIGRCGLVAFVGEDHVAGIDLCLGEAEIATVGAVAKRRSRRRARHRIAQCCRAALDVGGVQHGVVQPHGRAFGDGEVLIAISGASLTAVTSMVIVFGVGSRSTPPLAMPPLSRTWKLKPA